MLQSTSICIKCAGRMHQLFDFNLIKTNTDLFKSENPCDEVEDVCMFCDGTNMMHGELQDKAKEAIQRTKWSPVNLLTERHFKILIGILKFLLES